MDKELLNFCESEPNLQKIIWIYLYIYKNDLFYSIQPS